MTGEEVGAAFAEEAVAWISTPVVWNQSTKGRGADCKGLAAGAAREIGLEEASSLHALEVWYREGRPVPVQRLKAGLAELFDRVPRGDPLEDGMILLVKCGRPLRAQHLAIVTKGGTRAVHADGWSPRRQVRERDLEALLGVCPLDSAWKWRARKGCVFSDD